LIEENNRKLASAKDLNLDYKLGNLGVEVVVG
jgi:hypothetical protein